MKLQSAQSLPHHCENGGVNLSNTPEVTQVCVAVFTVLAEANMDVLAYDMHGHGLSEPKNPDGRVCIRSAQHLLDDAEGFLEEVVLPAVHRKSSTPHQVIPCYRYRCSA